MERKIIRVNPYEAIRGMLKTNINYARDFFYKITNPNPLEVQREIAESLIELNKILGPIVRSIYLGLHIYNNTPENLHETSRITYTAIVALSQLFHIDIDGRGYEGIKKIIKRKSSGLEEKLNE